MLPVVPRESETSAAILPASRIGRMLLLAALLLAMLGLRVPHIESAPLDFHGTRQYHSAILARALYLDGRTDLPAKQLEAARATAIELPQLELPLMEWLAVAIYRLDGGESFWAGRALAALFWVVGGAFLYGVSRRFASAEAAFVVVAMYLALPFAVAASRSFQPDPLMVATMIASWWAIFHYREKPSTRWLLTSALTAALAVLLKPTAAFILLPVFAAATWTSAEPSWRRWLKPTIVFFLIACLLPAAYFARESTTNAGLTGNVLSRFQTELLLESTFWRGWLFMLEDVTGSWPLLAAVVGFLLLPRREDRWAVGSMWCGYFLIGLTFTHHTHTHDYYSLPLIPIVALSMAPLIDVIIRALHSSLPSRAFRILTSSLFVAALLYGSSWAVPRPLSERWLGTRERARSIGEKLEHSTRTLLMAPLYGFPLEYHGWLNGTHWPYSVEIETDYLGVPKFESVAHRLAAMMEETGAEYFIVTAWREWALQPELGELLSSRPLVDSGLGYLVFDLRGWTPPLPD